METEWYRHMRRRERKWGVGVYLKQICLMAKENLPFTLKISKLWKEDITSYSKHTQSMCLNENLIVKETLRNEQNTLLKINRAKYDSGIFLRLLRIPYHGSTAQVKQCSAIFRRNGKNCENT